METLICRSFQSFLDFCDNNLVQGMNIHCTFQTNEKRDHQWMKNYLFEKGGLKITFSDL
jgi:hypothetical protein